MTRSNIIDVLCQSWVHQPEGAQRLRLNPVDLRILIHEMPAGGAKYETNDKDQEV